MKMIKYFLPILSVVCLTFLLQNCKGGCENGDDVTDYHIIGNEKIPYKGFEALTFIRTSVGDTHTFVGDGWKQYWGLTSSDDDCPQEERYEMRQLTFRSTTFPKSITISIYVHKVNKWTLLDVGFQNEVFQGASADVAKPYDLDSSTILGVNYYEITLISDLSDFTPVTHTCYYNKENGILKMLFENGETWELLKQ